MQAPLAAVRRAISNEPGTTAVGIGVGEIGPDPGDVSGRPFHGGSSRSREVGKSFVALAGGPTAAQYTSGAVGIEAAGTPNRGPAGRPRRSRSVGKEPLMVTTYLLANAVAEDLSRGAHLLFAMIAVGALVFQRVALRPALDEGGSPELAEGIRRRWAPVVHVVITLLLVTGLYQLMTAGLAKGKADSSYHMWFGIKFIAALAIFFLVSALAGRSQGLAGFREKGKRWLGVSILLAVVVVAISIHIRSFPTEAVN